MRTARPLNFQVMTCLAIVVALALSWTGSAFSQSGKAKSDTSAPPKKTSLAWTAEEAQRELALNPSDPFLQYVVLRLAPDEAPKENDAAAWRRQLAARREQINAFNLFTGALAVQESLQLDAMTGTGNPRGPSKLVPYEKLQGPTIKSHPWEAMLGDKKPRISAIAKFIPSDQYLVQARSITKLVDLLEVGNLWSMHLFNQAVQDATSSNVSGRLREQLAVRVDPVSKPFYDSVVDQVAITGSDLYLREGSDVTVIFAVKQPLIFATQMNKYLDEAAEKYPSAKRMHGEYLGVKYTHLATPDRKVHVFSAYPRPDLHVRSNSRVGLERVLSAINGRDAQDRPVERLGETAEFRYIRTLMKEGADEEDAFVYLSDPFIRHIVGPKLKLTEQRRMVAYNHMRMLGHAALLYRTQFGQSPGSIQQLVDAGCAPSAFATGGLVNPFGGRYTLAADRLNGFCSVNGLPSDLIPCAELPLENVTQDEANQYQQFLDQYNDYWRNYFDPIAIRVKIGEKKYRAETIVLPLINNNVYNALATTLGGEPEPLDKLPVPKGNIFSLVMRWNKEALLSGGAFNPAMLRSVVGGGPKLDSAALEKVAREGFGNQIGMHIYDAAPLFDLNFSSLLGDMFASRARRGGLGDETLWITMLIASLNSPVYMSLDVKNREIVDGFLDKLDDELARMARQPATGGWFQIESDFYRLASQTQKQGAAADNSAANARTYSIAVGPLKWRFFAARIGDGFYIATKKTIIDDLVVAENQKPAKTENDLATQAGSHPNRWQPVAHGMLRIRPENWRHVLPEYRLGWAENNRRAVLNHLSMLSSVARAMVAQEPALLEQNAAMAAKRIVRQAEELYGVQFVPPDGGEYLLSRDGRNITHSLYGSQLEPRQPAAPVPGGEYAVLLESFAGATAELTFLEDGLHAVLTIERK